MFYFNKIHFNSGGIFKPHTTFSTCVITCEEKRTVDGDAWNGMVWDPTRNKCWCFKNDSGHDPGYSGLLHFKME